MIVARRALRFTNVLMNRDGDGHDAARRMATLVGNPGTTLAAACRMERPTRVVGRGTIYPYRIHRAVTCDACGFPWRDHVPLYGGAYVRCPSLDDEGA
jgi:hypothetical protein